MASPTSVDWQSAATVAERLGVHTRQLVAGQHVAAAREWCVRMARENDGHWDARRSLSYTELATLLGHREPEVDDLVHREWSTLLAEVEKVAAAVGVKAAEQAAAEEAAAKAEAEAEAEALEQLADATGRDD